MKHSEIPSGIAGKHRARAMATPRVSRDASALLQAISEADEARADEVGFDGLRSDLAGSLLAEADLLEFVAGQRDRFETLRPFEMKLERGSEIKKGWKGWSP